LAGAGEIVDVVTLIHHLHALPNRRVVTHTLGLALAASRRAVLIVQPNFDAGPTLMKAAFKLFPADQSKSVTHVTKFDIWQAFRLPLAQQRVSLALYGRKPFQSSACPSVVPLQAPPNLSKADVRQYQPSQPVMFDELLFEELVAVIVKRDADGRPLADAEAIVASFGKCTLLNRFEVDMGPIEARIETRAAPQFATGFAAGTEEEQASASPAFAEQVAAIPVAASNKGYLFVCGVPRSGTTALTRLLNGHSKIGIGIERYRFRAMKHKDCPYQIELFEKKRFFNYRPEDGAVDVWQKYSGDYEELASKWKHLAWTGDKVPRLYLAADNLLRDIPDARLIFILRDVFSVAASWQGRADDTADLSWPVSNGWSAAVEEWNRGVEIAANLIRNYPDRVVLVDYQDIFSEDLVTLRRLFGSLGLRSPRKLPELYQRLLTERGTAPLILSDEAVSQISAASDQDTLYALRNFCL